MKLFEKTIDAIHKGVAFIQAGLLGLLLAMVVYQICARWISFIPRALWTEEVSRFLLVWVIFLGAAIGVRERSHFILEILGDTRFRLVNQVWQAFIIAMEVGFCTIFLFRGYSYAEVLRWDVSDIAQISMLWVGASIPIFGGLSLLFLAELIYNKTLKGAR
jgi:TRAP-type transport system small permease protein